MAVAVFPTLNVPNADLSSRCMLDGKATSHEARVRDQARSASARE